MSLSLPHAMNSSCTQLEVGNMVLRQLWTGLSQIFCEMLSPPIPGVHFLKQFFFSSVATQKQPDMNSLFSAAAPCFCRGRLLGEASSSSLQEPCDLCHTLTSASLHSAETPFEATYKNMAVSPLDETPFLPETVSFPPLSPNLLSQLKSIA